MLLMINALCLFTLVYLSVYSKKKNHDDDEIKEALDESYDRYLSWPNI